MATLCHAHESQGAELQPCKGTFQTMDLEASSQLTYLDRVQVSLRNLRPVKFIGEHVKEDSVEL